MLACLVTVLLFGGLAQGQWSEWETTDGRTDEYGDRWTDEYGDGQVDEYGDRWSDENAEQWTDDEGPTKSQMMEWLSIHPNDIYEVIKEHPTAGENGQQHFFEGEMQELMEETILPEFCDLKAEECTLYNSHLLDCNCHHKFDQVSEKCRSTKCDLARHVVENGPRIMLEFTKADSMREAIDLVKREVKLFFQAGDLCKCGKELIRASIKCAKFYNANVWRLNGDSDTILQVQTVLRHVDLESMSALAEKLLGGMCEKSRKVEGKICLDNVFEALKEVADMAQGTIEDWDSYSEGTTKDMAKLEGQCDRFFGPLKAWSEAQDGMHDDLDDFDSEEEYDNAFTLTSAFMNNLYCKWPCKKDRGSLYPCCVKRLMSDESIYSLIEKIVLSIVRIPFTGYEYWEDFTKLHGWAQRDLERAMNFTISERMKDNFKSTVNAGKFCSGRTLKCSN